ncbi:nuclear pore complex subunit, partial [Protomyces lactucae-debilis]
QGPSDSISSLEFSPDSSTVLLSSSWDGHLRVYDTAASSASDQPLEPYVDIHLRAPILDACFIDGNHAIAASLDGSVKLLNLGRGNKQPLLHLYTRHTQAVSSCCFSKQHMLLLTGSWDKTLHIRDIHALTDDSKPALILTLPEKCFKLSCSNDVLVVAMANRAVHLYQLAELRAAMEQQMPSSQVPPMQRRESSLKFMTRTVQCTPDNTGFVSTSIEGRVAVEFFDAAEEIQARKYAFKCHRQKEVIQGAELDEKEDVVYPVNAVAFHPKHGSFATGGGDGVVAMWDIKAKRRVKLFGSIGKSVSCLAFSADAKTLAMGT